MFIVELGSENNQEMEIEVLFPGDFLWHGQNYIGKGVVEFGANGEFLAHEMRS